MVRIKNILIILVILIGFTGCINNGDSKKESDNQENMNKLEKIIYDMKNYKKENTKGTLDVVRTGIYIYETADINYYSLNKLESMKFSDRVDLLLKMDKNPGEAFVVIGEKIKDFNNYVDLIDIQSNGNNAAGELGQDTLVYDSEIGKKILISGVENKLVGLWKKESTGLDELLELTADGIIEYQNYKGTYFSTMGHYTATSTGIETDLDYKNINEIINYEMLSDDKLTAMIGANRVEDYVRVTNKASVSGKIKYSNGNPVKGKVILMSCPTLISREVNIESDGSYNFSNVLFAKSWSMYRVRVIDENGKYLYLGSITKQNKQTGEELGEKIINDITIKTVTSEVTPIQENMKLIKEFIDVEKDENYVYPTAASYFTNKGNPVYNDGILDIKALRIYEGDTTYEFEIETRGNLDKIWSGPCQEAALDRVMFDIYLSSGLNNTAKNALPGRNIQIVGGYEKVVTILPYSRDLIKREGILSDDMIVPFVRSKTGNKIRVVVSKEALGMNNIKNAQLLSMAAEDLEWNTPIVRGGALVASQWSFGGYSIGETTAFDMLGSNSKTTISMKAFDTTINVNLLRVVDFLNIKEYLIYIDAADIRAKKVKFTGSENISEKEANLVDGIITLDNVKIDSNVKTITVTFYDENGLMLGTPKEINI